MKLKFKIKQFSLYPAVKKCFFTLCLIMFFAVSLSAQNQNPTHPDWTVLIQHASKYPFEVKIGLKNIPENKSKKHVDNVHYANLSVQYKNKWFPFITKLNQRHRENVKNITFLVDLQSPTIFEGEYKYKILVKTNKYENVRFVNIGNEDLEIPKDKKVILYLGNRAAFNNRKRNKTGIKELKFAIIGDNHSIHPLLWKLKDGSNLGFYLQESEQGIHRSEFDENNSVLYNFYALQKLAGKTLKIYSHENPKSLIQKKNIFTSGVDSVSSKHFDSKKRYFALIEDGDEEKIELRHGLLNYIPFPAEKETNEDVKDEEFHDSHTRQKSPNIVDIDLIITNVTDAKIEIVDKYGSKKGLEQKGNKVSFPVDLNKGPHKLIITKEMYTNELPLFNKGKAPGEGKRYEITKTLKPDPYVYFKLELNVQYGKYEITKDGELIKSGNLQEYKNIPDRIKYEDFPNCRLIVATEDYRPYDEPLFHKGGNYKNGKVYTLQHDLTLIPIVSFKLVISNEVNSATLKITKKGKELKQYSLVNGNIFRFSIELKDAQDCHIIIDSTGYERYDEPLSKIIEELDEGIEYPLEVPLVPSPFTLKVSSRNTSVPISEVSTQIHYKNSDSPIYSVWPKTLCKTGENGNVKIDGVVREHSGHKLLILSHKHYQTYIGSFEINNYEDTKIYSLSPKIKNSYVVEFDTSNEKPEARFLFAKVQGKEIMNAFDYHSDYTFPYIDNDLVYKEVNFSSDNGFSVKINGRNFVNLQSVKPGHYDADYILLDRDNQEKSIGYKGSGKIRELEIPDNEETINTPGNITNILIENINDGKLYTALKTKKSFSHPVLERGGKFNLYAIENQREPHYIPSWNIGSRISFDSTSNQNIKGVMLTSNIHSSFNARFKGSVAGIGVDENRYSDNYGIMSILYEEIIDFSNLNIKFEMKGYIPQPIDFDEDEVVAMPIFHANESSHSETKKIEFNVYNVIFKPVEFHIVVRTFPAIASSVFRNELELLIKRLQMTEKWAKVKLFYAVNAGTFNEIPLEKVSQYFRNIISSSENTALGTFSAIDNLNNTLSEKSELVQVLYITPEDPFINDLGYDVGYEKKINKLSIFEIENQERKSTNSENFEKIARIMDGSYSTGEVNDIGKIDIEKL